MKRELNVLRQPAGAMIEECNDAVIAQTQGVVMPQLLLLRLDARIQ